MKKVYLLFTMIVLFSASAFCAQFSITTPGFFYSPATTNLAVGDTVNISASSTHPCVEVSQTTWNNNQTTPLAGGFGVHSSSFMIVISAPGTIYFLCQNHGPSGMKGQIVATASNVAETIGDNTIKLLSSSIMYNEVTILNTTGYRGEMQVYDLSGKLITVQPISNETRQQVTVDLNRGIFLYRFNMEGNKPTATERLYVGADLR
ncbi:MAG: T9SS type A sorting domain-containing protein [Bacteroidota bacterium]